MLYPGLYEQVINNALNRELAEIIREGIQKNLEVIGIEKSEKGVYVSCLKSYF